ncbi:aggregation-promoting factor C-terminal-like domain-containing protein [Agromyces arachidis]|uniref:aggregation-promoting factor C-terminal-like domain-containing protein n=1 Tax=Agromyces arachidis TaxID=766966 RepID=UPI00405780A4
MGRHTGEYGEIRVDAVEERRSRMSGIPSPRAALPPAAQAPSAARAASHGRVTSPLKQAATVVFAFVASVGFLLVNVVDPYSGATASSTYVPVDRFGGEATQEIEVRGEYSASVASEGYLVEKYVEPEPEPASAGWAPPSVVPDPGSAQAYAAGAVAARGWGSGEFDCLVALWNKESGWRVNAMNPSSGAYGIPQALPGDKMATAGADWATNAATQIEWGLGYISGRYGTPCGAWSHSVSVGWY